MFFSSIKEINKLKSKECQTFTYKLLLRRSQILDILSLKNLCLGQFLESSNSLRYHWILGGLGVRLRVTKEISLVWIFYYFNFERNYDVLNSKSPCILFNKNINFNKNETESKMENSTHSFRETNLLLQLIEELQIKSKTVMSWISWKKKEGIFCTVYFVRRIFFLTFVFYTLSEHTYFYISKNITSYTFLLVFKIIESLQCILKAIRLIFVTPKILQFARVLFCKSTL